jgi:hypothetical protein
VLTEELEKAQDELNYKEAFKKHLPEASLVSQINPKDLEAAFTCNKRELVSLFNEISHGKQILDLNTKAATVFGVFTVGTAYTAITIEPMLFYLPFVGLIGVIQGVSHARAGKKTIERNIKQIQNTAIDFKTQLPAPQ